MPTASNNATSHRNKRSYDENVVRFQLILASVPSTLSIYRQAAYRWQARSGAHVGGWAGVSSGGWPRNRSWGSRVSAGPERGLSFFKITQARYVTSFALEGALVIGVLYVLVQLNALLMPN